MNPKNKITIGLGIPIVCIIALFGYLTVTNIDNKSNEWSNNATLFAEVGIGFVITLFVVMLTKLNEYKMDIKISNVLDIVKEREKLQKEKEKQVYSLILSSFKEIDDEIKIVLNESKLYKELVDDINKKTSRDQIILNCNKITRLSKRILDDQSKINSEFFDFDIIEKIKTISSICKNKPQFNGANKTINVSDYTTLQQMILPVIAELDEKIDKGINSEQPTLELSNDGTVVASSDRIVYPLNSTMHMRANLSSVIKDKNIIFEVFNSKRKLLLSQTINPEKHDYSELAEENIFQACFKMEGDEWKVGETYIVRATHGSSYGEDSFMIDQRTPIIQSDKGIYLISDDIIITVIDPDADKDNQEVEFIGDRENSKVIIESDYGKIDGYTLRETGNSTGIFQGIVGILGIRKNGTVIPQNLNGRLIDKIQGTGIEDGFIGGRSGDEITITYKNDTKVVSYSIIVSNFKSVIEMDQKLYKPTDKVYVAIIIPDFNLEKIGEIGQTSQNIIQIRTSTDKLDNYKLVAINPNTRIFMGELQLTPINKKPKRNKSEGPTGGILGCNEEDFIEIVFTPFGDEPIVARARIKS